ncbi:chaplin, partial [Streptomyces parvulus]
MRQVTRKGLMTMAAATGVIAAAGGAAHADSGAHGSSSGSPGVLSGNTVQAPVHVPVNVCGNTVDVVGVLNPAMGNSCANRSGGASAGSGAHGGYGDSGGRGGSHGGAHAGGRATDSPGVGSGNHVEVPVHVPVNVCGNTVDVVGVLNPATANDCGNPGVLVGLVVDDEDAVDVDEVDALGGERGVEVAA